MVSLTDKMVKLRLESQEVVTIMQTSVQPDAVSESNFKARKGPVSLSGEVGDRVLISHGSYRGGTGEVEKLHPCKATIRLDGKEKAVARRQSSPREL